MAAALTPPSFWLATCGDDLTPRPPLGANVQCDVAIVGAGYTGLWTAYHLTRIDPALRVVVVEREIAGWGASGRNGGWCSALFAASWQRVAAQHGMDGVLRLRRALERTVDDVGDWCRQHAVDAHFAKGGTLTLARGAAQVARERSSVNSDQRYGGTDTKRLDSTQARARLAAAGVDGAAFTPHCAAVQPARLVRGLARVVEAAGVRIHERTPASAIESGLVRTPNGTVRAEVVVRATEGYTCELRGEERTLIPLWSLVLATEPLPAPVWEQLGWRARETVTDGRHLLVYAQRTADDRIVLGGRGAPYRFRSGTAGAAGHRRTHERLEHELRALFPAAADATITHRWGGVLGVPRDWMPSVGYDRSRGIAWAGGYVGDGVGCSALAGRTLADLITGQETDETTLPWVGHRWSRWEPEPVRWLGVRGMTAAMAVADRRERRTGRPSRLAGLLDRVVDG
ncbi:MAG: FAD-dependent oxidoreductase [Frankiales bacterium]|nr:FAD-dependent oxidoreductase [Frankiales bacterium]